ncbi:MAG: ATP-binding protein [Pseudomonadota bacterium]
MPDRIGIIDRNDTPSLADTAAALPVSILLIAPDGMIADANAAAETLLAASRSTLARHALSAILHFADPRLALALDNADADITVRDASCRISGIEKRFSIDMSLSPMAEWPGWRVAAMIPSYAPDGIASYSDADDGAAALRGPEILAHEIKNPLAGIRGAAQLLARQQRGRDDNGEGDLVALIAHEVDRIAELIDRMQFRGRAVVGQTGPVNVHEVLDRVKMLCLAEHDRQIRIVEHYDPSLPEIMASVPVLTQIVHNLVSNAADACLNQDNPVITLSSHFAPGLRIESRREGKMIRLPVEIRVTDNGPGVADSIAPHLFTPFATSKVNGQGLGLALVRQMVTQMQGRIVYRRDEDKGETQFRLFFAAADQKGRNT